MTIAPQTKPRTEDALAAYAQPRSQQRERRANTDPHAERLEIPDVTLRFGLSRSRIYRLLGQDEIEAIKVGFRTLISVASVRAYLARQPAARIRPPALPTKAA